MLGYKPAEEAIKVPLDFMLRHGRRETGGFGHILSPNGHFIDGQADTYDHAFVLMSLAWAYKATGEPELLKIATETINNG